MRELLSLLRICAQNLAARLIALAVLREGR